MRASSPREPMASERGHACIRRGSAGDLWGVSGLGGGCARSPRVACFKRRSGEDVVVAGGSVARLSGGRLEDADRVLAGGSCRPIQVGQVERHGPRAVGTAVVVRRAHEHGQRRRPAATRDRGPPGRRPHAPFHGAVPKFRWRLRSAGWCDAVPELVFDARTLQRGGSRQPNREDRLWIVRRYDSEVEDFIRDRAWVDAAASG